MSTAEDPMSGGETKEKLSSTLLWRIQNISSWDPEFHEKIESPSFEFFNTEACCLFLYLKGEKEEDKKFVCSLRYNRKMSPLDYEWSLLDGDGSPVVTRMVRNAIMEPYQYVDFLDWPTYEDVFRVKKSSFLTNNTLILRCRFWKSDEDFEEAEYISGYTEIEATEKSFLWRIKKFGNLQLEQELMNSFVLDFRRHKTNVKLKFSLKGNSLKDAKAVFEIIIENGFWQVLTANVSILDREGKTVKSFKSKNSLKTRRRARPSEKFQCLPKSVLMQEIMDRKSDWLHDDDLTILCQFQSVMGYMEDKIDKCYNGPENLKTEIPRKNPSVPKTADIETKITDLSCGKSSSAIPDVYRPCSIVREESSQTPPPCTDGFKIALHKSKSSVATLQKDLLSMYEDHTLCDFELRSGDASIHVHKMILVARSPVFKAMFCGEMKEASSDFLDVPDLDVDTLNRMLTFMYTGTYDHLEWERAAKLYYAADKYQVQSLKEECLNLLQSGTSVQNVSDILELADRHQDRDLELFVHDFLVRHFDEVVLSEEWGKFLNRNSTLAGNVMRDVYKKKLQKSCK